MVTSNAAHRALVCQEIVENIFQFLEELGDASKTLAGLARTCRSFSSPALRLLWRTLPSLRPLFQLLPQYRPVRKSNNREYTLHGQPTDDEWALFQLYARWVRHISWDIRDLEHSNIPRILHNKFKGTLVLPRLERLCGLELSCQGTEDQRQLLEILLPPTLLDLTIHFPLSWTMWETDEHSMIDFAMEKISTQHPRLRTLSLSIHGVTLPHTSLHPLVLLKDLGMITIDGPAMDNVVLSHVAALPALKTISATVQLDISDERQPDVRSGFSNVDSMTLRGSPRDIIFVISSVSFTTITRLSLTLAHHPYRRNRLTDADSELLVAGIASMMSDVPSSLVALALEVSDEYPNLGYIVDVIHPILNLQHLTQLELIFKQALSFEDYQLTDIFTTMSNLCMFRLPHYGEDAFEDSLSSSVLEFVAFNCPQLSSLQLPHVYFGELPPQDDAIAVDHGLKHLAFFAIPNRDIEEDDEDGLPPSLWHDAAVFINRLFPRIDLDAPSYNISGTGGKRIVQHLRYMRDGAAIGERFAQMGINGAVSEAINVLPPLDL